VLLTKYYLGDEDYMSSACGSYEERNAYRVLVGKPAETIWKT